MVADGSLSGRVEDLVSDARGHCEDSLGPPACSKRPLMRMSREEAVTKLLDVSKIDNREKVITSVNDNGLLGLM